MDARRSETWFFVALLAIAFYFVWLILAPSMSALVLAGVLAFLFKPLYQRFVNAFHSTSFAAFLIVLIVALIIFVPFGFLGARIFGEATALYGLLAAHGGFDVGATIAGFLKANFKNFPTPDVSATVNGFIQQGLTWVIQNLGALFSGLAQVFFLGFLSLFGLFYFLKDGERLKEWLLEIVPLAREDIEGVLHQIEATGRSVIEGTLMIAVIQGVVMGVGFFIFGIPDPAFWGALTVFISIIPAVGTWLAVIPAVAYLFLTGQTALAIALAIWSAILVNLVGNVLAPQLMHRNANIHPFLILLSVLGGIALFGPIGFITGPLVVALLLSLLKIYPKLVAPSKAEAPGATAKPGALSTPARSSRRR
jgi:predicted PurR-regulated permease PerM